MINRPCQAKDPSKCRYHGTPETTQLDPFEVALLRNERVREMEKVVAWKREWFNILATRRPTEITTLIDGLSKYSPADVEVLNAYNTQYEQLKDKLTENELTALKDYTGISYSVVNQFLLDEDKFIRESRPEYLENRKRVAKNLIEELDKIFDKAERVEHTVYRYMTPDTTVMNIPSGEEYAKQLGLIEGQEVSFNSYLSTTIDPHLLGRYAAEDHEENITVIMVVNTDKGIPVGRTATRPSEANFTQDTEREMLLPRGMKFKVDKVTREVGYLPSPTCNNSRAVNPVTVYLSEI